MSADLRTYVYLRSGYGFYSSEPYDTLRDRVEAIRETITRADECTCPPLVQADMVFLHGEERFPSRISFDALEVAGMSEVPAEVD